MLVLLNRSFVCLATLFMLRTCNHGVEYQENLVYCCGAHIMASCVHSHSTKNGPNFSAALATSLVRYLQLTNLSQDLYIST